jgi:uncharacterized membrane protein (DUF485 family)
MEGSRRVTTTALSEISEARRDARFGTLRSRYRGFAFTMTAVFLAWFLFYVLCSAYARDFMATKVAGNINMAMLLGFGQFLSTFAIALAYSRYAAANLDPLADELRAELDGKAARQ